MTREELILLSDKIAAGIATEQEITDWYQLLERHRQQAAGWNEAAMGNREHTGNAIKQQLQKTIAKPAPRNIYIIRYAAVAALLILMAGAGIWLGRKSSSPVTAARKQPSFKTEIGPGTSKATLTLSNGSIVVLDGNQKNIITDPSGLQINNENHQLLSYQSDGRYSATNLTTNLLSTPRGGQYQLTLPDGTKVWLNAASSIRFPVSFIGNTREVEVTGEVYFDIVKNPRQPFFVLSKHQKVEVLGTGFCLNAYEDEEVTKTTLVEGSVKVISHQAGTPAVILKPAQQAQWQHNNGKAIKIITPDVNAVIAWKNGLFQFSNADIHTIMREISRWYEVDIKFKNHISNRRLTGKIRRSAQLAEVLEMLSYAGLELAIQGNTIEVGN